MEIEHIEQKIELGDYTEYDNKPIERQKKLVNTPNVKKAIEMIKKYESRLLSNEGDYMHVISVGKFLNKVLKELEVK